MKTATLLGTVKTLTLVSALVFVCSAQLAWAGETSVYIKSGWFSWDEKLNGSSFVKEQGVLYRAGIARKDDVSRLKVSEFLEVWGGNVDYDGHDVTGETALKTDTTYLGTREEVSLGVPFAASGTVSIEPFAALGHKFWIRTRSSEDWNSFYVKAGVAGELKSANCTMFVRGGTLVPVYTRTHVSLSSAGYTDVVTEPKNELSGFVEGGVKVGAFVISVEYEGMRFGQSDKVSTSKLMNVSGGVVQNNLAYQPDSRSDLFTLKLAYSF